MKNTLLLFFLFSLPLLNAQDSAKTKLLHHEAGLNVVTLVKQMVSNGSAASLTLLPYDFFYNLYYKDMVGIRLGAGASSTKSETSIEGQALPKLNYSNYYMIRTGVSYNFLATKRLAFNAFADYVIGNTTLYFANTATAQTFPNPTQTITTEATDVTATRGGQVGVGVKFNFTKNISVYTEMPYAFLSDRYSSEIKITDTGDLTVTNTNTNTFRTKLYVPTTIYLVLRF
jgi:hypothetical protein